MVEAKVFPRLSHISPQKLAIIHERHIGSLLGVVFPAFGEVSREFNSVHPITSPVPTMASAYATLIS